MAVDSASPSVPACTSVHIGVTWYSPTVVVRTAVFCFAFFLLGRQSVRPPAAPRNHIVAEVLWGTALARSHIGPFLPKGKNTTAVNEALRSAILDDHAEFADGMHTSDVDVNDAFFSHQIGLGIKGIQEVVSLRHRNCTEFLQVSRAVATVAGRLLEQLGAHAAGKKCAVERRLQAWATVHAGGSAHEMHVHAGAAVAAVYYVTVPADGGVLRLHDPRGPRPPFDGVVEIRPREGEIIAFPAWVVHEVAPGGEGERISIAFNVPGSWDSTIELSVGEVGLGQRGNGESGWTLDWGGPL